MLNVIIICPAETVDVLNQFSNKQLLYLYEFAVKRAAHKIHNISSA